MRLILLGHLLTSKNLTSIIAQSSWRFKYHIQPQTGLLNDPNGFSYFNNRHLFYQAFPFGSVHGLKVGAHLTSSDLIHWDLKELPFIPTLNMILMASIQAQL